MVKIPAHVSDLVSLSSQIIEPNRDPRTTAIVLCSYIEVYMEELLASSMPKMNQELREKILGPVGHLATLQSKLDVALALGLINSSNYKNGKMIGRIRNIFAHNFKINTFDDEALEKCLNKLQDVEFDGGTTALPSEAGERFAKAALMFMATLSNKIEGVWGDP